MSRVTVRKALELLRDEGLIDVRQGFGWFVATDPVRQSLGRLGTIEAQLGELGVGSERRIVGFRFARPAAGCARCWASTRCSRCGASTTPTGSRSPASRCGAPRRWAPGCRADVETSPFYELVGVPIGGAVQTIGAAGREPGRRRAAGGAGGSPVLRCERITDVDGHPLLVSEHVFPGHRTEFVVELPHVEPSISPSGLRLVE